MRGGGQVAGDRQGHADDAALGGGVRRLADLAVERRDAGEVHDRAALAVGSGSSLLISVAASRIASKVPIRLIAITFGERAEVVGGVELAVPADGALGPADAGRVDQVRSGPSSAAALRTAALICSVSVTSTETNAPPISCGERLALVGLQVGDHDVRARGGELAGDGGADARGGAGDDGRGSGDVHAPDPSGQRVRAMVVPPGRRRRPGRSAATRSSAVQVTVSVPPGTSTR